MRKAIRKQERESRCLEEEAVDWLFRPFKGRRGKSWAWDVFGFGIVELKFYSLDAMAHVPCICMTRWMATTLLREGCGGFPVHGNQYDPNPAPLQTRLSRVVLPVQVFGLLLF